MLRKAESGFKNAGGTPATAKGQDSVDRWIIPGRRQVSDPLLVCSGEVAPLAGHYCWNLQMPLLLRTTFEQGLKIGLRVHPRAWIHGSDAGAGSQRCQRPLCADGSVGQQGRDDGGCR